MCKDRTKNTELSSDKKTDGDFSLLCKVYGKGAPALVAVMFQCIVDWTSGMIEDQLHLTDYTLRTRPYGATEYEEVRDSS